MSRLANFVLAMSWTVVLAPSASAQAQATRTQIPVVTRLVQLYSDYEQQLVDAINDRNVGEIDRLVASDFELRSAAHPGVPIPRADWIVRVLRESSVPTSIEEMAVHDYGNIRIVSFIVKGTNDRRADDMMVVDVWMQSGEASVLKTRYAAKRSVF